MVRYVFAILLFFTVGCEATEKQKSDQQPIALIYAGPGVCDDGNCAQNAADVAIRAGLAVRFVQPTDLTPAIFNGAVVWIQPGGDSIEATNAIGLYGRNLIRNFIASGGGYLGFCAGGYFAAREIDTGIPGLGLVEGEVDDYSPGDKSASVPQTLWNYQFRQVYFEDGPTFEIRSPAHEHPVAFYPDGRVAAMKSAYGLGRVALSGPHPEAPPSWRDYYQLPDRDGDDYDLAHDLLNWTVRSSAPMKFPDYTSDSHTK